MLFGSINLLAVGVSALGAYGVGFLWNTSIFREPYIEDLGRTAEELAKGPSMLTASIMQIAGALVTACIMAWLMPRTDNQTVTGGLMIGLLTERGFVAAVIGPTYAFKAFSLRLFGIISGYHLLAFLITGVIIGAWGSRG